MSFMAAREHGSKTGSGFISAEQGVSNVTDYSFTAAAHTLISHFLTYASFF
jgi:hypothetical protein